MPSNYAFRTVSSVLAAITLSAFFSESCRDRGSDYECDHVDGIQVRTSSGSVVVLNTTGETIYYFIVERNLSAVIDWMPACEVRWSIQSGKTKEIPYSEVIGYKQGCAVVMSWWHCSGTTIDRPGGTRSMVFQTPP